MVIPAPATKTTASRPSLRTVMNGNKNMAYFLVKYPNLNLSLFLFGVASKDLAILTLHLACILLILNMAIPMKEIITVAIIQKTPSQISSEFPKISFW